LTENLEAGTISVPRKQPLTAHAETNGIIIHPRFPAEAFRGLELDSGLGSFAHYSSIIQKLEVFERIASKKGGRVSLALRDERIVVGYLACWYPEETERWSRMGELMYELGAIEVSRNFRKTRIASQMLDMVLSDDFLESKIMYMNGFSWHWDLDGTGLNKFEYRKLMLNLLKNYGFRDYYTNEPNVALREENLFMARIGSEVSEQDRKRFSHLRFGIYD
jgi:acetoin utilization protein AcuA